MSELTIQLYWFDWFFCFYIYPKVDFALPSSRQKPWMESCFCLWVGRFLHQSNVVLIAVALMCLFCLFIALHNVVTILSESILMLCWRVLSLWFSHHNLVWCKRPGDGDYLVEGRSCFERFFCASERWCIGWLVILMITSLVMTFQSSLSGLSCCFVSLSS